MSSYDKRYNVVANMVSFYTDDPVAALRHYYMGANKYASGECSYPPYIVEGYGEEVGYRDGVTEILRRTTGKVLPSTLEFLIQRAYVQDLMKEIA